MSFGKESGRHPAPFCADRRDDLIEYLQSCATESVDIEAIEKYREEYGT